MDTNVRPAAHPLYPRVRKMASDHLARVIEFYMFRVLSAIVDFSEQGYNISAVAIAALAQNRRKVSPMDNDLAVQTFFYSMLADSREPLELTFLAAHVEPSVLFGHIELDPLDDESFVLCRHIDQLLTELDEFKVLVFERYRPLIKKQVGALVWTKRSSGLLIENDDTTQNFQMATIRAMDKFDPNSGTFTSYLANWLKNAWHSGFNIHVGESFSISRAERYKIHAGDSYTNNHAASLDNAIDVKDEYEVENSVFESEAKNDLLAFIAILHNSGQLPSVALAVSLIVPTESLINGLKQTGFPQQIRTLANKGGASEAAQGKDKRRRR